MPLPNHNTLRINLTPAHPHPRHHRTPAPRTTPDPPCTPLPPSHEQEHTPNDASETIETALVCPDCHIHILHTRTADDTIPLCRNCYSAFETAERGRSRRGEEDWEGGFVGFPALLEDAGDGDGDGGRREKKRGVERNNRSRTSGEEDDDEGGICPPLGNMAGWLRGWSATGEHQSYLGNPRR